MLAKVEQAAWPPCYVREFQRRQAIVQRLHNNADLIAGAKAYYARPENAVQWINDFCTTYDPRNAGTDKPTRMPFILFPKQEELVEFILAMLDGDEDGLIEKARDMGASWVCVALSVYLWLFWDGMAVGWGSLKDEDVDKLGVTDSLFEKMRMLIRGLPKFFWPVGFSPDDHMTLKRIINPENGSSIVGKSGKNIGRGGRTRVYFKDESAHYEQPEAIEAALGDNTRVQIDISSVNGSNTVFYRKTESGTEWRRGQKAHKGTTNVFVLDWSDHPHKTQEWFDTRKAKAEEAGLLHVFAQEVERNSLAAVEGIIVNAEHVKACIDAHIVLGFGDSGGGMAALDVADGEIGRPDKNAFARRKGVVLYDCNSWGARDTGVTTRRAIEGAEGHGPIEIQYDCVGVGSGVKSEANSLIERGLMPKGIEFVKWDAGQPPQNADEHLIDGDEESRLIGDHYHNLKAQGWDNLRIRAEKTFKCVQAGELLYPVEELMSLSSEVPELRQLVKELSQPTQSKSASLKMLVNKQPKGTRSPNLGDVCMMVYHPVEDLSYTLDNL